MAKYHELVKEYEDEIAYIKREQKVHDARMAEMNAIPMNEDNVAEIAEMAEQDEIAYDDLLLAQEELWQNIVIEYQYVPFAAPRNAGIAGFYRVAGLDYAG